MQFLESHPIILAIVIIGGSVGLSLGSYFLARLLLNRGTAEESKDLAGSVIFRVAALHGLILALVFAQEILNYNSLRTTVSDEAIAVGDVFFDLSRYDAESTVEVRKSLANYVSAVVEGEWETLGRREGLAVQAWRDWESVYQGILDLQPTTHRQDVLYQIMLSDVRAISGYRRDRENAAAFGVGPIFWLAAVVGLMLVPVAFFTFPPTRLNMTLVSIFASYSGLVLFCIAAFSNPYKAPARLEPSGFERLLDGEMANFVTRHKG